MSVYGVGATGPYWPSRSAYPLRSPDSDAKKQRILLAQAAPGGPGTDKNDAVQPSPDGKIKVEEEIAELQAGAESGNVKNALALMERLHDPDPFIQNLAKVAFEQIDPAILFRLAKFLADELQFTKNAIRLLEGVEKNHKSMKT
jgi:hypothetical protein